MFDLEKAVAQWRRQMTDDGINLPDVLDELESHLRERVERFKAGMNAQEAFQTAARELGESKLLKREFARASRNSLWNWRENPTALNIVGVWLILMGLNAVSQIVWIAIFGFFDLSVFFLAAIAWCLLASLQIPLGISVMRHVRLSRYCAFFLLAAKALWAAFSFCSFALHVFDGWSSPGHFILLGLPISTRYSGLWDLLVLVMSGFAVYVLSRPEIRELFRPKSILHRA